MRDTDLPATHREVHIAAAPARVWEIVADIEAMAGWSPELVDVEWQGDAYCPAVGARYAGRNEHPRNGTWRTISLVTELVPERSLAWCVLDADGRYARANEDPARRMATWSFALAPAPDGTVLRQSVTIGPGPTGLNAYIERAPEKKAAIVAYRLDELGKGMDATLNGIKAAAERRRD
ncbi:SRPBCC family protein [Streptomyces sp. NPDC058637]|uniref:SRPBCC family protein n=1 Tax=Streptomyces sp. NPDC058637 TaxID=3346569 RepID=UPI003661D979